jgi:predicted HTH transcriptional regulator
MAAEIRGLRREEEWEYPLEGLREAVVNAICHRDYATSANVQEDNVHHFITYSWNDV